MVLAEEEDVLEQRSEVLAQMMTFLQEKARAIRVTKTTCDL